MNRGSETWRLLSAGLAISAALYAVAALSIFPKWTVDDAYITYRYAENFARHAQMTWNVGEDPVEGYTGVLLPTVLSVAIRLGLDADVTSKTLGAGSLLLSAALLGLVLRRLGAHRAIAAAVALCYISTPVVYAHAWSGLETMEFAALLAVSLYALVASMERAGGRTEIPLFAVLLLTALTRPEGAVFAACATIALVAHRLGTRGPLAPTLVRLLAVLAAPAVVYFVWRVAYYGQWLPNTYYSKARGSYQPKSVESMLEFFTLFLLAPTSAVLAALVAWCVPLRAAARPEALDRGPRLARALTFAAVALFLGVCLGQYSFSSLRMNFAFRFFAPLLPFMLLLLGLAASAACRGIATSRPRAVTVAVAGLLVAAGAWQVRANAQSLAGEVCDAAGYAQLLDVVHVPAGRFLRERVPPDEWMVVVLDAGAIPYFSKLKTIDFGGLNDEYLSKRRHRKLLKSEQADYFFSVNPGVVVFTSAWPDRVDVGVARRFASILEDPRFAQYELAATFSPAAPQYYELIFLRRDLVSSR